MSIGYLVPSESAVVWRGPMLLKAIQQLLHDVDWGAAHGGLDVLVLDLPPGTGDIQLSITQQVELNGAVIVTTPHTLSVADAIKGINFFKKVGTPLLGLVQNMSVFCCPGCGKETAVFGGSEKVNGVCEDHGLEFLGDLPLSTNVGADMFMNIARKVAKKVGIQIAS